MSDNLKILEIGPGPKKIYPNSITIDHKTNSNYNINISTDPLPFPSNQFDLVDMRHVIEHIYRDRSDFLIGGIYKVLKPGGTLFISCPDLYYIAKKYVEEDLDYLYEITPLMAKQKKCLGHTFMHWIISLGDTAGADHRVFTREGKQLGPVNHIWAWDFGQMKGILSKFKFKNIEKVSEGEEWELCVRAQK